MKVTPIITSFGNGEISQQLMGRVDLDQMTRAAEKLENVLVRPYGNAINRTGSEFIANAKHNDKDVRLIDFVFSTTQTYCLEFGDLYIRFYTDQAQLISGSSAYTVTTPYTEAQIRDIQYAQSGDVMFLVHPSHMPRKLTRVGATNWTLTTLDFVGMPQLPDNTTATKLAASGTSGSVTITASSDIFNAGHVGSVWAKTDGSTVGYFRITAYTNTTTVTATVLETLGDTTAVTTWSEGAWSIPRGCPETIIFHEDRLVLGGSASLPQTVWFSEIGVYDNFKIGTGDDEPFDVNMPTRQYNKIEWLSSGSDLVAGTSAGEFIISGGTDTSITAANVFPRQVSAYGSSSFQSKVVGSYTYFVQNTGRKIREFLVNENDYTANNYRALNMTILSEQATDSGVKDWTFQKNQDSILWVVRNDGQIATFTREYDQQVQAWTRQITDGEYLSVCAIPRETGDDDVYVAVRRTINGSTKVYIELFSQQIGDDIVRSNYLDSSLVYDAYAGTIGKTLTLSAITGSGVTATASGAYFSAGDVGRRIREINSDYEVVGEARIIGYTSGTVVTIDITRDFSDTSLEATTWAKSIETVSGLDHLEGEDIAYKFDGAVVDGLLTVSSGAVSLPRDMFYVIFGIPFVSEIKTFPLNVGSQIGTSQTKLQAIHYYGLRVYNTQGITIGDETDQYSVFNRSASTPMGNPEPLFTGDIANSTGMEFERRAQIVVRQSKPLPMNILAIIPHVEVSEV